MFRKDQRGVAMITVLLVGAVLTVLATTAAFSTIREFKSSTDDRKSTEALSYAESGVDRFIQFLRQGGLTWKKMIRAGCENAAGITIPPGVVAAGTYNAVMKVYEPNPPSGNPADRFVPGACNYRSAQPNDPQGQFFVISSTGSAPTAKRVIQQVVKVSPIGIPVGVYAPSIDANGNPTTSGISMFTDGQLKGREKIGFNGIDNYYYYADVFPDGVSGHAPTEHVPAAAHALGGIYLKQNGTQPEFPGPSAPTTRNCTANPNGQSLWDSDGSAGTGTVTAGCTGQTGYPLNSKLTSSILANIKTKQLTEQDYQTLKDAAKANGIYCSYAGTTSCTRLGTTVSAPSVWDDGDVAPIFSAGINNFVVYMEFASGDPLANAVKWHASVWPCNPTDPDASKSVVVVVRRGSFEMNSGASVNGAILIDGELKFNGNATINGTVISQSGFWLRGGETLSVDSCWVDNMPGSLLTAKPTSWAEIDR